MKTAMNRDSGLVECDVFFFGVIGFRPLNGILRFYLHLDHKQAACDTSKRWIALTKGHRHTSEDSNLQQHRCEREPYEIFREAIPSSRDCLIDPLKMGPIGCPETAVNNYQFAPRNIAGERRSQLSNI